MICVAGITALKYAWMSVLSEQARNASCDRLGLSTQPLLLARNFAAESERRVAELGSNHEIAFEKFPALDAVRWCRRLPVAGSAAYRWPVALRIDWIDILSQANSMKSA
ncbi:MAG: hypothetical protein IPF44_11405, partial [Betaproteobacteria bacterium]|nr:hypothetical protein [Betaproteobacteria bacterium]